MPENLENWLLSGKPANTKEMARMLGKSQSSLHHWRIQGKGPKFVYFGNEVAYLPSHVKEWLESVTATSTADGIARGLTSPCKRETA